MTFTAWTVSAAFLDVVGFALALAMLALAVAAPRREARDDRGQLLALVTAVLALVRFAAWPLYYALLASLVPALEPFGVMCAFGVARIHAPLSSILEWTKPIVLCGLAFALLLRSLERRAPRLDLSRGLRRLSIPLALAAAGECALEGSFLLRESAPRPVTCCTQFSDAAGPSVSLASTFPVELGLPPLVLVTAAAVVAAWLGARGGASSGVARLALATAAPVELFVAYSAWLGEIAPRVLGLPYHHCLYEVVLDVPMLGLAAVMTLAGSACLAAPLAITSFVRESPPELAQLRSELLRAAAALLAGSLLVVLVHVL